MTNKAFTGNSTVQNHEECFQQDPTPRELPSKNCNKNRSSRRQQQQPFYFAKLNWEILY